MRLTRVVLVVAIGAAILAGVARALDFADGSEPESLPRAQVGKAFHFDLVGNAGCLPYRFTVLGGALPPGLELKPVNYTTNEIVGTPTEAGTFGVWIGLDDPPCRESSQAFFSFDVARRKYAVKTETLKPALVGSPYTATLQAGGADIPPGVASSQTWAVTSGSPPAGLTLAADGTVAGTPIAQGSSMFTVTATLTTKFDGTWTDSRQYTLDVLEPLVVAASRRAAEVGVSFSATLTATGGRPPYTLSVAGTPPGLSVGAGSVITGVPKHAGSFSLKVHVVDANGNTNDVAVALSVHARLAIATRVLPSGVVGRPYSAKAAVRGGVGPLRWRITGGSLPRGLRLDASGTVNGKPTGAGASPFTVRVRDSLGAVSTRTFLLSVRG